MKYSIFFFPRLVFNTSVFLLVILLGLSSCKTIAPNGNNTQKSNDQLDPIIAKNTNPKDTIRGGNYTPITSVKEQSPKTQDTIAWCDTLQKNATERVVVCFEKVGNQAIKADTVAILSIDNNALYHPTTVDTTIRQKLAYQVAIMMPFMSHSFVPAYGREIPIKSIKALEFYEGVLIALDSLKREGVNLFVNVFDTGRDTAIVQELLTKRELQEADMIIGPFTSKNLKLVAQFAKENQKTLISPLNSRHDLVQDNPYFIQVNPCFDVHSKHIIEHLSQVRSKRYYVGNPMTQNLLILALNRDSSRVASLQKHYAAQQNDLTASIPTLIRQSATIDIDDIKSFLKKDELNIIIMPTFHNEGFIYNSLREIQKLVDKVDPRRGYQIVVIGMDRWRYFSRINFEYYESLNLHFSSEYFTDLRKETVRQFRADYKAIYGIGSREFGFKGFDIMLFFGRMIHKYGINFPSHLWKERAVYNHTRFQIEPTYNTLLPLDNNLQEQYVPQLRSYENKYVNFLKFSDYQLQQVVKETE